MKVIAYVFILISVFYINAFGGTINPLELDVGQSFTVSKVTPLAPEVHPVKTLAVLKYIKNIPKGGAFKILKIVKKNHVKWYYVLVIIDNKDPIKHGWVNSYDLFGQNLKKYK